MARKLTLALVLALSAGLPTEDADAQSHFLRGDVDGDGVFGITDGIVILNWRFLGEAAPACEDAADIDDDGNVTVGDPVRLFNWLFQGGPPPERPWPSVEKDPTDDDGIPCKPTIVPHSGDVTADETWAADTTHELISAVIVRDGATLTIEAGVTVLGDATSQGLLVVDRGGRLVCEGSNSAPIVFTSDKPVGQRGRGDWGGLILLGRGDNNTQNKQALAEGLENQFWGGGDNVIPDDDSGRLSYVRVEYGGTEISVDNEVNAISIFGCGSGTTMDHVQAKFNLDDGFEWFGGAASLTYGVATGIGDDSFDFSFGWRGIGQFWLAQQRGDDADRGFEVDNHEDAFASLPITQPTISNVTLVGDPDTNEGTESTTGITWRRGTGAILYNAIVTGFKSAGIDVDDSVTTQNNPADGTLVTDYSVFYNNGADGMAHWASDDELPESGFSYTTQQFISELNSNNVFLSASDTSPLVDPYNLDAPNFQPQGAALDNPFDPTSLGAGFVAAPYRGAVAPAADPLNDWTQQPWISYWQN